MKQIVLYEQEVREDLFPFTRNRSVIDLRVGILTLREKWNQLGYDVKMTDSSTSDSIPANIIPTRSFIESIKNSTSQNSKGITGAKSVTYPWHIFQLNAGCITDDFEVITTDRKSEVVSSTNKIINPANIFIEKGANVEHAILNASSGPIYIGKNAEIMEGSMIRGPFALCEGSVVKMGTKIYGGTIGPYCVVGGEIKNSVLFGYSNKAHDGYLGDSVIGEWCNLGAGTSNSNLKNNASDVNVWNEHGKKFLSAGTKCGLLMGDYSRSAINTSFNTGTVVGICCNVFGSGFAPKYVPDFSWGYNPFSKYRFETAIRDISNWKKLKNQSVDDMEIRTLQHIFEETKTNME